MIAQQRFAFGREGHVMELRRQMDVGERKRFACEISLISQKPGDFIDAGAAHGHDPFDGGFIGRLSRQSRLEEPLPDSDRAEFGEEMPVVDPHELIHASAAAYICREQRLENTLAS